MTSECGVGCAANIATMQKQPKASTYIGPATDPSLRQLRKAAIRADRGGIAGIASSEHYRASPVPFPAALR
jgi:alkanesulfonate monooxygenase SsuD/methylene tetrahydromethanopterin reductase-like flavin-dependent oxidoreductase (luciferase family)